jgi:Ca-activated chloride channel family protein
MGAPAVEEPSAPEPAAAESAPEVNGPAAVDIAARFEISWKGPGNPEDFISVARPGQAAGASISRTSVREGNPVKLWAPSDPGDYEIRYVVGRGSKLLAKAPLTVNAVAASVEAPAEVDVAARIEVKWQGPAAEGDFISVALPSQAPGAAAARANVRDGNPAKLWMPGDAGQYEIRYILGRGTRLLAKEPITLNAVTATVTPPASVKAGFEFEIPWQGPGYPEDFISIARVGQPPNASVNAVKVKPGGVLKLRAPREPGAYYEVRYVLGRGPRVLAKAAITIEAP